METFAADVQRLTELAEMSEGQEDEAGNEGEQGKEPGMGVVGVETVVNDVHSQLMVVIVRPSACVVIIDLVASSCLDAVTNYGCFVQIQLQLPQAILNKSLIRTTERVVSL